MSDQRRGGFWTSLTGIITAVGTFVAAVGTILGLLAANNLWIFKKDEPAQPAGHVVASETSLDFAEVQQGLAGATKTVTVTNKRNTAVTLGVAVEDDASGSFAVALDKCSDQRLDPGASCLLEVGFSPTKVGQLLASVEVSPRDGQRTTVTLKGVGKPAGQLSFNPTAPYLPLFTNQNPVPANAQATFKISNTGDGNSSITSVRAEDATHFTVSAGCSGKTLVPAASCSVTVTFSTTKDETVKSNLVVTGPGYDPYRIQLTGYRGPKIVIKAPVDIIFPTRLPAAG